MGVVLLFLAAAGRVAWAADPPYAESKLRPPSSEGSSAEFGDDVTVSADGSTMAVSEGGTDCQGPGCRAVRLYLWNGSRWQEETQLKPPGLDTSIFFWNLGSRIVLSPDGQTLLLAVSEYGSIFGRPRDSTVHVFTRQAGHWTRETGWVSKNPDRTASFGTSMALSQDGQAALVGAPFYPCVGFSCGFVFAFDRLSGRWYQEPALTANEDSASGFGAAVAVSADAKVAIIGADGGDCVAGHCGAAYVFRRGPDGWAEEQRLKPDPAIPADLVGESVALSADGSLALVAGRAVCGPRESCRVAFVYAYQKGSWSPVAQFANPDAEGRWYDTDFRNPHDGSALALSGDGRTALLAGSVACGTVPGVTPPQTRYCRTAALFSRAEDGTWSQIQALSPPNAPTTAPLALSRSGSLALLGATYVTCSAGDASNGSGCGYVYQYAKDPIPRSPILDPVTPVPTLGAAGLAGLALLLAAAGAVRLRRRGAGG